MEVEAHAGEDVQGSEPTDARSSFSRYAVYALVIIFFANFLSYCDRQIVSALEEELRDAFKLSEAEFGGLWTAFTIGYMVFAPFVGYLADRHKRTRIFAVCIFLWSLATIATGMANDMFTLYTARFFIGIGEAGCLVIGPSLIADYFAKEVRGKALSVFFLGLPLGGTLGYVLPAIVTRYFGDWRDAFVIAGAPGLLLSLVVWLLMDPPRGGHEPGHGHGSIHGRLPKEGLKGYASLFRNRTLMLIILAQAFAVFILVPLLHFGVHFFETKHQMKKEEAALTLGIIALVAGGLGNWLSGIIGDRLAKRVTGAYALLAGVGFLVGMPWLLLGFTTRLLWLVLPALTMGAFCYFLCMPAVNTQIANVVPSKQRAMAFALAVFILHFLGDMSAPILFGEVNHHLRPVFHAQARQVTFVLFSFSMLFAGACSLLAMRSARQDEERAQAIDDMS